MNTQLPNLTETAVEGIYANAYHFYENGKYEEAVRLFKLLVVFDGNQKRNWVGLGAALQMMKQYQDAVQAFALAATLEPSDPYPHFHAAECFLSLGNIPNGLHALRSSKIAAKKSKKYLPLISRIALMQDAWSPKKTR